MYNSSAVTGPSMVGASDERPFDVIPFEVGAFNQYTILIVVYSFLYYKQDIKGEWKKLGSGSFGNVYRGVFCYMPPQSSL